METKIKRCNILILFLFLFLISCSNILNKISVNSKDIYEPNINLNAYFCPRDNCAAIIKNLVDNAESSVHCALYDLDLKELITAIAKKSKKADVKIVIDHNNYDEQIKGPGIKVAKSKQYMHNKFCIVDNKKVLTGSFNPTTNGAIYNNNNVITIDSEYIAVNYEDEFNELWNGIYVAGDKVKYEKISSDNLVIENYFCPEDGCKQHTIDALSDAQESIYFMTFSFTDEDIADAILFKNVDIKGIFETTQAGSKYSQYQRLKDFGLDVKKDKNKRNMHHKAFIIDRKIVLTGSFNPTGSGNFRNDENIIIIHNKAIADKFLGEFNIVWNLE